jgi:SAM-dependent methyltransferase
VNRRERALRFIDLSGRGLEIGPSYDPLVAKASGARVETVDHADRETLVAKYTAWGLSTDKTDRIETVDHLWSGGSLLDTIPNHGAYDYIVASHFIEHTVDLIRFLSDCEGLLNPTGRLALVVPDKRFSFDRFQPLSTVGAVVDAFHSTNVFHTAGPLLDHQAYACKRGESIAWNIGETAPYSAQFPNLEGAEEAIEAGRRQEEFRDIHKWKFTPASFALLIRDLAALGFHNLGVVGSDDTHGFEFYVTLAKGIEPLPVNRIEMLLKIESELMEPRDDLGAGGTQAVQQRSKGLSRKLAETWAWRVTAPLRRVAVATRRRRAR